MKKNILLGLGVLITSATPVTLVSCGSDKGKDDQGGESIDPAKMVVSQYFLDRVAGVSTGTEYWNRRFKTEGEWEWGREYFYGSADNFDDYVMADGRNIFVEGDDHTVIKEYYWDEYGSLQVGPDEDAYSYWLTNDTKVSEFAQQGALEDNLRFHEVINTWWKLQEIIDIANSGDYSLGVELLRIMGIKPLNGMNKRYLRSFHQYSDGAHGMERLETLESYLTNYVNDDIVTPYVEEYNKEKFILPGMDSVYPTIVTFDKKTFRFDTTDEYNQDGEFYQISKGLNDQLDALGISSPEDIINSYRSLLDYSVTRNRW